MTEHLVGYPVVVEQAVAWGEMDSYEHVNNVVYFRYFENARLEYFRRLNWFAFEKETGIGRSTAVKRRCDPFSMRPLTYPDTILIDARMRRRSTATASRWITASSARREAKWQPRERGRW